MVAPLLCVVFVTSLALSQETTTITPTTGPGDLGTTVTSHGHTTQITGGIRPGNGTNLFHSFNQFSIGPGDTAQFQNTTPTLTTINILSRVTGGNPSSLSGTINTMSYPGANFSLMNPAGIVIGPTATLNVSGSVAFTTADYLRLAEGPSSNSGIFHAASTETSLLTSAPVAAFGFLNSNPAAIAVQGSTLTVQPGESISFIGGNHGFTSIDPLTDATTTVPDGVTITGGHLVAPDGHAHIASVASRGEILATNLHETGNINGHTFTTLGALQISQQSSIDIRGDSGDSIRIRGGHLVIDSSTLSSTAGQISVDTDSVHITNSSEVKTETTTAANAGHITLNSQRDITLDSDALIISSSRSTSGHAGDITLQSQQGNIALVQFSSVTTQSQMGSGKTGSISIDAPHGDIRANDSYVYTSSQGTGKLGGIQITARNLLLENSASILGNNLSTPHVAEPITITTTGRLNLTGGAIIETGTAGPAKAADLLIRSPEVVLSESSMLITSTTSSGDAGQLRLFTDNLQLSDGARLSSGSLIPPVTGESPVGRGGSISIESLNNPGSAVHIDGGGSGIFTNTQGSGAAGDIFVAASSLILQNGGTISAQTTGTSLTATGGSITITATDQAALSDRASITASSTGTTAGNAGTISLNAGRQLGLRDQAFITTATESAQANGGNIEIRATDLVRLVNKSEISTSVKGAEGSGGNIFIDPQLVIVQGSAVTAQAVDGAGGNITFVTPLFLADSATVVSASSQQGPSGTVTIQSPTSNLSGTVGQLPATPSPPQVLLQNHCVAKAGTGQSTFLLTGRNSLPEEPGGWLNTPVSVEHWMGEDRAHASAVIGPKNNLNGLPTLATPSPDPAELSLRHLTPPGFLVRSFATGSTNCRS
ncbi:MAG: filamentous hemagglutinin N-terminal domain-containing protein [Nitrospira sp.]|nr:filamentous hemagglutinin N-terminal domain-containing protein [Nitrospira sp.]